MKINYVLLAITAFLFIGCCNSKDVIKYQFEDSEKEYVPYSLNQNVTFINNENDTITGIIIEKTTTTESINEGTCSEVEFDVINSTVQLSDYSAFNIRLTKYNFPTFFEISFIKNNISQSFIPIYDHFSKMEFRNITFNNINFENAVLFNTLPNENGEITGSIIYSKTRGIEYILFKDGTWYKRVE